MYHWELLCEQVHCNKWGCYFGYSSSVGQVFQHCSKLWLDLSLILAPQHCSSSGKRRQLFGFKVYYSALFQHWHSFGSHFCAFSDVPVQLWVVVYFNLQGWWDTCSFAKLCTPSWSGFANKKGKSAQHQTAKGTYRDDRDEIYFTLQLLMTNDDIPRLPFLFFKN